VDDRELLRRLAAGASSGDVLAREAGITRAAVWKRIEGLRAAGLRIDARPGRGYALSAPLELLDAARLRQGLSAPAAAALQALEVAWVLDSTSTELLRRPPGPGVEVLLAERQEAGRGRMGRRWVSPLGGQVCLSVRRGFNGGLARLGGLSLVAGVAVAEALRDCGYSQVGLKWPNDLLADGRKLAGLLVEGGGEHGGPVHAVIGIGINVDLGDAGEGIDQAWTDLTRLGGRTPSRNDVAIAVLDALLPALELFDREGLAAFQSRYAALDVLAGHPVRVLDSRGGFEGQALGLAPDGALRVAAGDGERRVHAGEVSVRRQ